MSKQALTTSSVSISAAAGPLQRDRRKVVGRYKAVRDATDTGQLPKSGECRFGGIEVVHGAVRDPNPAAAGKRQRVAINRNTDALEREYAAGRISEEAYQAGRIYQAVLERSRGALNPSRGDWLMPMGGSIINAQANAIVARLEAAGEAIAMLKDTARILGMVGQRVLELVLIGTGDGTGPKEFGQIAGMLHVSPEPSETEASYKKRCERAGQHVGFTFRTHLDALAEHWALSKAPRARWSS